MEKNTTRGEAPHVEILKACLSPWKRKHFSFGGRVVQFNIVLFALHLYCLSFYKAYFAIMESIQKIQREFISRGIGAVRKID
ncbi:hypothetical protein Lal_00036973 [Lupinus albus]|nr:hypothetical protein Lal_00036973 [Lupinus albus]